jgi:polyisoprenoid-binding protein YceI
VNKFISAFFVAGLAMVGPLSTPPAQSAVTQSTAAKAPAANKSIAASTAPTWVVDARQSRIGFSTRWAGDAVNGNFRQWGGDIKFDPANLAASNAIITILTGSALTGMKEPDDNIGGGDWLDARRFPTARYETTTIRAIGANRYVADGLLTIKGVAYRLALPFTLTIAGNVATMTGQATLDRMTLKLGLESDASASWVARETVVTVAVRATRR